MLRHHCERRHALFCCRQLTPRGLLCAQELQAEGWTPEEGDAQAGGAAPSAGEHRDICARVENMVVPELGSLAARCSRLVSQASVAFGARTRLET